MPPPDNAPIDPKVFAESIRALLDEDWRRYRNFGVYWFFVKALLKRFYDVHEMPRLGDYDDPTVTARIPEGLSAQEILSAAIAEYQANARLNLNRNKVEDPDGESFWLHDPDLEG